MADPTGDSRHEPPIAIDYFSVRKHERFIMALPRVTSCTGETINTVHFVRKHHPKNTGSNEWAHLRDFHIGGKPCTVYVAMNRKSDWVNIKVSIPKDCSPNKQNFWLAYNGERFSVCKDYGIARDHFPALVEWLRSYYSELCMVSVGDNIETV